MKASALLFTGVNQVEAGEITLREPLDGELLIENVYSCISPGTELRCFSGQQPDAAPYPFIPGYSAAGYVAAAGLGTTLAVGTPVWAGGTTYAEGASIMWGGHSAYSLRPEREVIALPPDLDLCTASLLQLAGIAYHGIRLSRPLPHETVLVVGLGAIGQFSARLHALTGARVIAADLLPERLAILSGLGIEGVVIQPDGLVETLRPLLPDGADVIVDATGARGVSSDLIALARDHSWEESVALGVGRYVIQGSYPAEFAFPYNPAFAKELTFLIPRHNQRIDLQTVCALMQSDRLSTSGLISRVASPNDAPEVYQALKAGQLVTAAFQWRAL